MPSRGVRGGLGEWRNRRAGTGGVRPGGPQPQRFQILSIGNEYLVKYECATISMLSRDLRPPTKGPGAAGIRLNFCGEIINEVGSVRCQNCFTNQD